MSPFWILLELRMMAVVMTTGAIRRSKLLSKYHCQQTNTQFFRGQMPVLSSNQLFRRSVGKSITFRGLAYRRLYWNSGR